MYVLWVRIMTDSMIGVCVLWVKIMTDVFVVGQEDDWLMCVLWVMLMTD